MCDVVIDGLELVSCDVGGGACVGVVGSGSPVKTSDEPGARFADEAEAAVGVIQGRGPELGGVPLCPAGLPLLSRDLLGRLLGERPISGVTYYPMETCVGVNGWAFLGASRVGRCV